ncbi:MAG: hypothetical protein FWD29_02080 [Micrococcales bacterium]|nr:hypothetical protein [Micrococcales bacterium]
MKPAWLALGSQGLAGLVLGQVWAYLAPQPQAFWTGTTWAAMYDVGFRAAADSLFAVLGLAAGLVVGFYLAAVANRVQPVRRLAWWLLGALVGSGLAYVTGMLVTGSFGPVPTTRDLVRAPLGLDAYGVMLVWPVAAMLAPALATALRWLFSRSTAATEVDPPGPPSPPIPPG